MVVLTNNFETLITSKHLINCAAYNNIKSCINATYFHIKSADNRTHQTIQHKRDIKYNSSKLISKRIN